jgi:hypothetical protein
LFPCVENLILRRGNTRFQSIKIWLARELKVSSVQSISLAWQGIKDEDDEEACDADLDGAATLDGIEYSITKNPPYISVYLRDGADCSCAMLPNFFTAENLFSVTFDDFQSDQSNGAPVCAIGFLRWHRQAMIEEDGYWNIHEFPKDAESYNRFVQVAKGLNVAWGNSSPAKWLDPHLGPFEMSKLFCKSLGSRVGTIQSFSMLDPGSMIRILHRCCRFEFLHDGGVGHLLPYETSKHSIWAHQRWYEALDTGQGALSEDDFSRINLILNKLLHDVEIASAKVTDYDPTKELEEMEGVQMDIPSSRSMSSSQSNLKTLKTHGSKFGCSIAGEVLDLEGEVFDSEGSSDLKDAVALPVDMVGFRSYVLHIEFTLLHLLQAFHGAQVRSPASLLAPPPPTRQKRAFVNLLLSTPFSSLQSFFLIHPQRLLSYAVAEIFKATPHSPHPSPQCLCSLGIDGLCLALLPLTCRRSVTTAPAPLPPTRSRRGSPS